MPPARIPIKAAARSTPRSSGRAAAEGKARPSSERRSRLPGVFGRLGAAQKAASARQARGGAGSFLRELRNELRKVEWPTREQATKLTGAVIGISAIVGVFLGGIDFLFQELFRFVIERSAGV